MSPKISTDQIEQLRFLIVEEKRPLLQAARRAGVNIKTARRYQRLSGWPLPKRGEAVAIPQIAAPTPVEDLEKPLLTYALILACQQGNGRWSQKFFDILGIPVAVGDDVEWIQKIVNQPVEAAVCQALEKMAKSFGNPTGKRLTSRDAATPAQRYALARAAMGIQFSYE